MPRRRDRTDSRIEWDVGADAGSHLWLMSYRAAGLERDGPVALARLGHLLAQGTPDLVHWVHLSGGVDRPTLEALAPVFGLHSVIVEDLLTERERPRAEVFDETVYMHLRFPIAACGVGGEAVEMQSIALILSNRTLLSVQLGEAPGLARIDVVRERLRGGHGRIRQVGPDHLCHALIDGVVDACLDVTEDVEDRFEALEDLVLEGQTASVVARLLTLRGDVLRVRRALVPLRDALRGVLADSAVFRADTVPHVRDVLDHATQVIDRADAFRELEQGLINLVVATDAGRMNEIMKFLTIMSSIFIPLSFIAGVYGMNFDLNASPWNMPEQRWALGYPFALLLMAVVAVGLALWFRRKGWLFTAPRVDRPPAPPERPHE